ncbi:unnamed protein product, partial [Ectocarpus sp. 8 AP-2014]
MHDYEYPPPPGGFPPITPGSLRDCFPPSGFHHKKCVGGVTHGGFRAFSLLSWIIFHSADIHPTAPSSYSAWCLWTSIFDQRSVKQSLATRYEHLYSKLGKLFGHSGDIPAHST